MKHLSSLLLSFFILFSTCLTPAAAERLVGHCVGVTDGDTCTLLTENAGQKKTTKIRFHGIDAPESHQDFGQASKKHLSELIYDRDIAVDVVDTDRYGRTVGKVFVGDTNVNLAMVQAGMAWWYRQYGAGETALQQAEEEARSARRGLWQSPNPIAPWDFRHKPALAQTAVSSEAALDFGSTPATATDTSAKDNGKRYWVTSSSGKTHNASCRWYATSNGYYSATGTGNNCKVCGGAPESTSDFSTSTATVTTSAVSSGSSTKSNGKRYWVTSSSGKTHNASCRWYGNSRGYYSATGTGNNCKVCGGAN